MKGALEKLLLNGGASSKLQGIIERLELLQDLSCQVVDEFNVFSRSIDDIKFTIRKVVPVLDKLKQELAKLEAQ